MLKKFYKNNGIIYLPNEKNCKYNFILYKITKNIKIVCLIMK